MAYFSNGAEGADYEDRYCARCVHYDEGACPVLMLHSQWNYEQNTDPVKRMALEWLWPSGENDFPGECAMFWARVEE